jgi:hypothetical protein
VRWNLTLGATCPSPGRIGPKEKDMKKVSMVLAAAGLGLTSAVVPMSAASAADGCGSGWYKEGDGYLTKDNLWRGRDYRSAWIYHSGKVRFCTDNDTFNDDENRRALIGYPSDSYPFQTQVNKVGRYTSFCVKQRVRAHMSGIKSSESWNISGTVSKSSPSVSASYSATYDTLTVAVARNTICGKDAPRLFAQTSGITLTADNESGKVNWVELHTTITATYWSNGSKYSVNHSVVERDYN